MESKIKRHQSSKEKGKSYQRTLSCKHMAKGQSMPSVGQYMIKKKEENTNHFPQISQEKKHSQNSLKITKNIKLILRQKHFQPASQVINDVVNKKITNKSLSNLSKFHSIQPQFKQSLRPISAQVYQEVGQLENIDESAMLKQAYEFDKRYYSKQQEQKKNTFMVKPMTPYPRYIQGYNLIKLDEYSKTEKLKTLQLQSYSTVNERNYTQPTEISSIPEQNERENTFTSFLPTEYYIIDDDIPQQLIQKYGSKDGKNTIGQSKWFDKGNYVWKKCRILGFDQKTERWNIEWLHTGKRKQVSRNNLRFEKEDKVKYEQKISKAEKYRQQSQGFLKYNWMIDLMQSPTHEIDSQKQQRIVQLATKCKIKKTIQHQQGNSIKTPVYKSITTTLKNLMGQIKNLYIRSNHQAQFNATLPFNQQRKQYFIKFLPQCLFHPNKQTQIMTHSKINITKQSKKKLQDLFISNLAKIKQKSSLANPNRLKILQSLNKIEEELEKCLFFKLDYKHKMFKNYTEQSQQISLQSAKQLVQNNIRQVFYMICCRICDLQYFVGAQLDPIYLQKKSIGSEQFSKIINSYRKFLYLVDFRLENKIQQLYISTLQHFLQPFQQWNNKHQNAEKECLQPQDQVAKLKKFRKQVQKFNVQTKYKGMKIKVNLQIKDGKLESSPQIQKVKQFLFECQQKVTQRAKDINCVSKSYIEPVRPNNKLHVLQKTQNAVESKFMQGQCVQAQLKESIKQVRQSYYSKINKAFSPIQTYVLQIQNMVNQITIVANDIKKRMQKKNNYNQIEESIQLVNDINRKVDVLIGKQKMSYLVLSINCQDIMTKLKIKIAQTMKQIYKLLHQRITRDNEKLEKQIDSIVQILDKQPSNIDQMIELQNYANTIVPEQFDKINAKVNATAEKVSLMQKTNCKVQYKDFQACFKIYVKPLKVSRRKAECLKTIQYSYKRTFGQQLTKQTLVLLQEIKQCEQKERELIQVNSLKQMEASFMAYSRLNERIKKAVQKMEIIQRRQLKMNWKVTNFEALEELNEEFQPFFKLISLAKNFHYQVQSQMQEPFYSIDAGMLKRDIEDSCVSLQALERDVFANNVKVLAIVKQVVNQYNSFKMYIPMMVALRNQDLKDRHWVRIEKLTGHHDIQSENISMAQLLNRNIHNFTNQIIEISEIASKQLTYQKQLNRLKKQWKEVKLKVCFYSQSEYCGESKKYLQGNQNKIEFQNNLRMQKKQTNCKVIRNSSSFDQNKQKNGNNKYFQNNKQNIKIISNLKEVRDKVQNDIFNAQTILSTDYVKFLQKDIIAWRNSVLYKVYETIDFWNRIQLRALLYFGLFANINMQQQIPSQFNKFKIVDRTWKASITQIESQPSIVELLQSKAAENMRYVQQLLEDIEKQISKYFQKRKQDVARLNCLSGQQMMKAYSATSPFGHQRDIDQFIIKCFPGIQKVLKSDQKTINLGQESQMHKKQSNPKLQVQSFQTNLYECFQLNDKISLMKEGDEQCSYMNPDKVVQSVERQIKKTLRDSLLKMDSPIFGSLMKELPLMNNQLRKSRIEDKDSQKQKIMKNRQLIEKLQISSIIQIKLLKLRIEFTFNVEEAINSDDPLIKLQDLSKQMREHMDSFVYLLKEGAPAFVMDHRLNIQSLIIIQLSNQIHTLQFLIQREILKLDSFEWLSQIRTYMRPDELDEKLCEIVVFVGVYRNRYNFSLVKTQSYIASYNSSKIFFQMAMALKQNMMICVAGNEHSGKISTINHIGERLGRQVTIIYCHKMMNQQSIIDSVRMGVSGLWTVCKNISLMSNQMLIFMGSTLQIVWSSLKQCTKKFSVNVHNTTIKGSCDSLGFFVTIQTPKLSLQSISYPIILPKPLRDYFRTITFVKPDSSYVVQTLLKAEQLINDNIGPKIMNIYNEVDLFLGKLYLRNAQSSCDCESIQQENQQIPSLKAQSQKNVSMKSIQQTQKHSEVKQAEQSKRINQFSSYLNIHELKFYKLVCSLLIKVSNSQGVKMMEDEILENTIIQAIRTLIFNDQIRTKLFDHLKTMFKFKYVQQQSVIGKGLKATEFSFLSIVEQTKQQNSQQINVLSSELTEAHDRQFIQKSKVKQSEDKLTSQQRQNKVIQNALLRSKLYVNLQIFNSFSNLLQVVKNNRSVVVLSKQISGKSALISALQLVNSQQFSIKLTKINPMSLEQHQLFGGTVPQQQKMSYKINKNSYYGVFNKILEELIDIVRSQNEHTNVNLKGIVLDSNLSFKWYQPILSLLDSSNLLYHLPNGGSISFPENNPFKFIFETDTLQDITPTLLAQVKIIPVSINLKWQNIFSTYLKTYYPPRLIKCKFLSFMQLMVPFIMDPVLQFYQNSLTSTKAPLMGSGTTRRNSIGEQARSQMLASGKNNKNLTNYMKIPSVQLVGTSLRMFQSLLQQQFGRQIDGQQIINQFVSDVFNFFIFSLIWTVGALIPDQSKNTFSRHFKYLIKRAVQINIKGIQKRTLPKDQQYIYDIYYEKGAWKTWENLATQNKTQIRISTHLISSEYTRVFYILKRYIDQSKSVFLVGKPSQSKNYIFKQYISQLEPQNFNKSMLSFSPNTSSVQLKQTIIKTMLRDKHSHKVNGFMNGKINIIYVCDFNLASVKIDQNHNKIRNSKKHEKYARIIEFLRQFYNFKSFYFNDSPKPFKFNNLVICGTLNSAINFPTRIMRYMNPLLISSEEGRLQTILKYFIQEKLTANSNQSLNIVFTRLKQKTETLIKCIKNFHNVIEREYQSDKDINFVTKDMFRICSAIMKMIHPLKIQNQNSKHLLMRIWIYQSESVYSQKMAKYKKEKLFYYLNNVLMEDQRERYKVVMPDPNVQITDLLTNGQFQEISIENLKKKIIQNIQAQSNFRQSIENQHFQSKQICQQNKLPFEFLVTDQMIRNIVKLSNGLTIQSPIAFCINRHSRNIRALVKILAFLKKRTLIIYQSKGFSEKEQKREWLEFIKEKLLQKLDSQQEIAILIQVNSKNQSSGQPNNPEYILDDLLNLKRIGTLSSLKLAQQQKFLEQQQCSPSYMNQNNLGAKNNNSNKLKQRQLSNGQESEEDLVKEDTEEESEGVDDMIGSNQHKIWAIMHYKQKNADLFKYYQSLLNESTVIWMTDHIQATYFEQKIKSAKQYIKLEVSSIVDEFQQNSCCTDYPYLTSSSIREYLIEKTFSYIPTLLDIHNKIMKNQRLLNNAQLSQQHIKSQIFLSFLSTFVNFYTQIIINHHQIMKNNQKFLKRIQIVEQLTDNLYKEIQNLVSKQKDLQNAFASISVQIQHQETDYKFYRNQHSQIRDTLVEKQKGYQENKQKYTAQMHKKRQMFEKWKGQINNLVTKQKKLVLTGQLKLCFQILTLIFGKKKDVQESKQMMKQFSNLKILKKINAYEPRQLNEKAYEKIRNMLQKANKVQKKEINNKDIMLQQTELLCSTLKKYFQSLLELYEKHKSLQNLWMKISEMGKQVETLKGDLDKKSKNKNYIEVLERYQDLIENKKAKQSQILQVKKRLNNCTEFKQMVKQFQKFKLSQKQKLRTSIQKAQKRQKNIQNFAITLGIKVRYQSLLNKELNSELIKQLLQQSPSLANSLKAFQQQRLFFSQKQIKANVKPQLYQWSYLQGQIYKQTLNQIFDNFNNRNASNAKMRVSSSKLRNASFSFKQMYMKVYLQKGCILVQRNAYFDEWIKKSLNKQTKQMQSIVNFIVDRTLKKSKTFGRFYDTFSRTSQQSNISDQASKKQSRKSFCKFLQLQDPNQIYKIIQKQRQKLGEDSKQSHLQSLQAISSYEQSTIIIYSKKFDANIISNYPLITLKDLEFQQVLDECYKIFESKKDSISQFDSKINALESKGEQQIDGIHECLIEIENQIMLRKQEISGTQNKIVQQNNNEKNEIQLNSREDLQKRTQEKQSSTKSITLKNPPLLQQVPQNFEMTQLIITQFKAIIAKLTVVNQSQNDIKLLQEQIIQHKSGYSPNFIRLIKFCVKFFYGLRLLSQRKYIRQTFSLTKYLNIIKNTVDRQAKNTNQRGKLCNSSSLQKIEVAIKKHIFGQLIWQDNTQSHGGILFTFMSVASMQNWQDKSIWKMIDFGLLLSLNVRLNEELAIKVTKKKNWDKMSINQKKLVQKCQQLLLHRNDQANPYIDQSQGFTNLFKSVFALLSVEVPALKPIYEDINKSQYKWVLFLLSLSERSIKLPQPFQTCGRVFLLFFILLFKPQLTEKWLTNFSQNMGNITYSANMVSNNAYLPLHVKLAGNLNNQFVWTPHWSFQNPLRKMLTIQKQLFYRNILIIQKINKSNQDEGSNSIRFVLNLASLMKRNLKIVSNNLSKDQHINTVTQAMRQGNWVFLDLENNQPQTLSQIKDIEAANQQNNEGISPQYTLWIFFSEISSNKKANKNLNLVRKHFNACVLHLEPSFSQQIANNYIDYSPLSFYESQSTNKRLRKQYDAMSEHLKIEIYKILETFDTISHRSFKRLDLSSESHCNKDRLFQNYASVLHSLISFEQDSRRSSIVDTIKVKNPAKNQIQSKKMNQQSKSRLRTGKKKGQIQQKAIKKFYTYNFGIKLQNLVICLRQYCLEGYKNLLRSNNINMFSKLQAVKREAMDDLTRNIAADVDLDGMLNIAKQCFNHERIKKSISSHQSIQNQLKSGFFNFLQFLHFCYYGTLHLHEKLFELQINDLVGQQIENPVYNIMLDQLKECVPKILTLKQFIYKIKKQYENIVIAGVKQSNVVYQSSSAVMISRKAKQLCWMFHKTYSSFTVIINIGQISSQSIAKYEELRRNLEYYSSQNQLNKVQTLQLNLKHYNDPYQLIHQLKREVIICSRLSIDEIDVLFYLVNPRHVAQRCQIETLSLLQSQSRSIQGDSVQKPQHPLKVLAMQNQRHSQDPQRQLEQLKNEQIVDKKEDYKLIAQNHFVQNKQIARKHVTVIKGLKLHGGQIINGYFDLRSASVASNNRNFVKEANNQAFIYEFDKSKNDQQTVILAEFLEKEGQFNKNEHQQRMKLVSQKYRNASIVNIPILIGKQHAGKQLVFKCPAVKKFASTQISELNVHTSY